MRILALLALFALAYPAAEDISAHYVQEMSSLAGFARWDCREPRPYFYIRGDMDSLGVEDIVREHETQHIRQMLKRGCLAWNDSITLRTAKGHEFRQRMEREATCVSYKLARDTVLGFCTDDASN